MNLHRKEKEPMKTWRCAVCGYIYDPQIGDPESGVASGVTFESLPDTWGCPECGADKSFFERYQKHGEETQQNGY